MGKASVAGLSGGISYYKTRVKMPDATNHDFTVSGFPKNPLGFIAVLVPETGYGEAFGWGGSGMVYIALPDVGLRAAAKPSSGSYKCYSYAAQGLNAVDMYLQDGILHCNVESYAAVGAILTYEIIVWY